MALLSRNRTEKYSIRIQPFTWKRFKKARKRMTWDSFFKLLLELGELRECDWDVLQTIRKKESFSPTNAELLRKGELTSVVFWLSTKGRETLSNLIQDSDLDPDKWFETIISEKSSLVNEQNNS